MSEGETPVYTCHQNLTKALDKFLDDAKMEELVQKSFAFPPGIICWPSFTFPPGIIGWHSLICHTCRQPILLVFVLDVII